jgi:exonuclease III
MLDHSLASPGLASCCVAVDILNDDLPDETTAPDHFAGSFHAPLVATFDLSVDRRLPAP